MNSESLMIKPDKEMINQKNCKTISPMNTDPKKFSKKYLQPNSTIH
jgi:hypothetical protein